MAAKIANSALVDCLIIGGGPAGLSTALTLGRLHRSCIVFDDQVYRNQKAHRAHGVLTRDHVAPSEIRQLGKEDLKRYGNTRFVEKRVEHIRKPDATGDMFTAVDTDGNEYGGRTVVLATGAADQLPNVPGYEENWGSSIYQVSVCRPGLQTSRAHYRLISLRQCSALSVTAMSAHTSPLVFGLTQPSPLRRSRCPPCYTT